MIHYQNFDLSKDSNRIKEGERKDNAQKKKTCEERKEKGPQRHFRNSRIAVCERCGKRFAMPTCTYGAFRDIVYHFCADCINEGLTELRKKDENAI